MTAGQAGYGAGQFHRVSALFRIGPYDRIVDQSACICLRDHILAGKVPAGIYAFSSRNLIIVTGQ